MATLLGPGGTWRSGLNEIRFDYGPSSDRAGALPASDRVGAAWRVEELALRPADGP